MTVTKDIRYIGVNDYATDLFEGEYIVPEGMSYNSYVILDDKIAIMDTVDGSFSHEWLDKLQAELNGRSPDYLIVQHMEPDHSANIELFSKFYPQTVIVSSAKAFTMMKNFFGTDFEDKRLVVGEGDKLCLGKHTLSFYTAPMVHWPEVIVTYDEYDRVLFSADGFGKFGAIEEDNGDWACEARRYYFGIVGKYGAQVQALLKKAATLDIKQICPLHGPVLSENLEYYIGLYDTWSSYMPESEGITVAYSSAHGNTKKAALLLADKLRANGCPKVAVNDLARCDMAEAIEDAFRYNKLVLASFTYNGELPPSMRLFVSKLAERGYSNRTVAIIENGSWAAMAAKHIMSALEKCKNITYTENTVKIVSALNQDSTKAVDALADELCREYEKKDSYDPKAMFNLGYGLYVVTTNDGSKDNGCIVNSVNQVTNTPNRISVAINKSNYTHHIAKSTGIMNLNCLSAEAPFSVFEAFGFKSGRNTDKFANCTPLRSQNGLVYLPKYINSYMSLKVEQYTDLGTHGMFICTVEEAHVISNEETMSYSYYHKNVKPQPKKVQNKGYVCKICGYVYEGEELPADFICPICKHPASDFEEIK